MSNQLVNRTLKCPKCKQFFYSYDGAEVCDICSYEPDAQEILQEFKENKNKYEQQSE